MQLFHLPLDEGLDLLAKQMEVYRATQAISDEQKWHQKHDLLPNGVLWQKYIIMFSLMYE